MRTTHLRHFLFLEVGEERDSIADEVTIQRATEPTETAAEPNAQRVKAQHVRCAWQASGSIFSCYLGPKHNIEALLSTGLAATTT